ncbi:MAG: glycosyltransferase family 9 protein [Pseudomonadota bacterium]
MNGLRIVAILTFTVMPRLAGGEHHVSIDQCDIHSMAEELKKIGILWGGGLGDLLMIRPFLMAVCARQNTQAYLLTTASHATELFDELCGPVRVVMLPRQSSQVLSVIKEWRGFFDLMYLGPYPTIKTRVLGHLLAPKKLWGRYSKNAHPFLLEQVLADITALGFGSAGAAHNLSAFLPWTIAAPLNPFPDAKPFLVVHPGAKDRWSTTRWPLESWKKLTQKILEETEFSLCIAGVAGEMKQAHQIIESLPQHFKDRIKHCLSLSIKDTAALVSASTAVICHNSGILHLSTFLQKKTLCITGSSARFWRPPYPWVINITSGSCTLACNCYTCPVPLYDAKCINKITVEHVWEAFIQGRQEKKP